MHSLPAGTAKRVQSDFVALSVRVQELKDWRTFATHPKREQFVNEMEALAAQPLQPAVQAERIRELRQAWQNLGPVTNQPASGEPASLTVQSLTTPDAATVTIGGQEGTVLFSGLAPTEIGVYQINVTVPTTIDAGTQQVIVSVGGVSSPGSALPVQ